VCDRERQRETEEIGVLLSPLVYLFALLKEREREE
jgi:hypothetical protein